MSDELMLDSMGPTPTGFEIKTHAGGPETAATLLFIADSMRSVLDGNDAPNYVEMEVKGTDGKRYIMTLQRAGKVTPHGARLAAEAAIARVEEVLDNWQAEVPFQDSEESQRWYSLGKRHAAERVRAELASE